MRIERINQNQIRCILTSEDLESRQIRLSELAYGSEKAKNLFRDMMQQAHAEFGFEAENIPLMIEMIPSASGTITLIVTKVENQEELDQRMSKFAPHIGDAASLSEGIFSDKTPDKSLSEKIFSDILPIEGADGILDIFQKFYDAKMKSLQRKKAADDAAKKASKEAEQKRAAAKAAAKTANNAKEITPGAAKDTKAAQTDAVTVSEQLPIVTAEEMPPIDLIRLYEFGFLDDIIEAAISLAPYYYGVNSLYKDVKRNYYLLVVHQSQHTPEEFNKICNMLSEYASGQTYSTASEAYLQEHKDVVIAGDAIQTLAMLEV